MQFPILVHLSEDGRLIERWRGIDHLEELQNWLDSSFFLDTPAYAGAVTSCFEPFVYDRADINTAILQFKYEGRPDKKLSETAVQLSLLIQLDALFSQVKYRSIGVTYLIVPSGDEDECSPERTIDRMFGTLPRSQRQIKPGKALIVMDGRIFEKGNEIFVQTDIRFLRRSIGEWLKLNIKDKENQIHVFEAQLPVQTVSFAPRYLDKKDIKEIQDIYLQNAVVRRSPNTSSQGELIRVNNLYDFAYFVTEIKEGWMRIESFTGGPSGWVHADLGSGFGKLREKIPELDFLEATAGYLKYRVSRDSSSFPPANNIIIDVNAALNRFVENADPRRDAIPLAALRTMVGTLNVLDMGFERGMKNGAVGVLFTQAAEMIPYNADALNLKALSDLYGYFVQKAPNITAKNIMDQLLTALSIEPANRLVLRNLENFFALLHTYGDPSPLEISQKELTKRLQAVRDVLAALSSRPQSSN